MEKALHEKHGTSLLELFYYQNRDGVLLDKLEQALSDLDSQNFKRFQ